MSVNLQAVAKHAGVSVRTVSNVVNDYEHVSSATRLRVQRSIDELGYRPNLAARTLRRGRTGVIGLAIPEVHSPYFAELASAIVRLAAERSWLVHIDQTEGDPDQERRLLDGSFGQLVDGMIVSPWGLGAADLSERVSSLPLVMLGERQSDGLVDHVVIDNVAAAEDATDHLIASGRTRIAAVGLQPHLVNGTAQQRFEGFNRAMERAALPVHDAVAVTSLHRAEGKAVVEHLFGGAQPPDALFCFTDELALGVVRALADRGLRVPQDVAIAGFDDIEDGRYAVPSLTTISPDKEQIAAACLECLDARIGDAALPARDIVVPHALVVRESTGPAS